MIFREFTRLDTAASRVAALKTLTVPQIIRVQCAYIQSSFERMAQQPRDQEKIDTGYRHQRSRRVAQRVRRNAITASRMPCGNRLNIGDRPVSIAIT